MIKIDLINEEKLKAKLNKLGKIGDENLMKALEQGCIRIEKDVKMSIKRGTRSGKTYNRKGKKHIASSPGEFPKSDSGNLTKNTTTEVKPKIKEVTVGYRDAAPYGAALEFGFRKGKRHLEARPALGPALEDNTDYIKKLVNEAIEKSVKDSASG